MGLPFEKVASLAKERHVATGSGMSLREYTRRMCRDYVATGLLDADAMIRGMDEAFGPIVSVPVGLVEPVVVRPALSPVVMSVGGRPLQAPVAHEAVRGPFRGFFPAVNAAMVPRWAPFSFGISMRPNGPEGLGGTLVTELAVADQRPGQTLAMREEVHAPLEAVAIAAGVDGAAEEQSAKVEAAGSVVGEAEFRSGPALAQQVRQFSGEADSAAPGVVEAPFSAAPKLMQVGAGAFTTVTVPVEEVGMPVAVGLRGLPEGHIRRLVEYQDAIVVDVIGVVKSESTDDRGRVMRCSGAVDKTLEREAAILIPESLTSVQNTGGMDVKAFRAYHLNVGDGRIWATVGLACGVQTSSEVGAFRAYVDAMKMPMAELVRVIGRVGWLFNPSRSLSALGGVAVGFDGGGSVAVADRGQWDLADEAAVVGVQTLRAFHRVAVELCGSGHRQGEYRQPPVLYGLVLGFKGSGAMLSGGYWDDF